MLSVEITNLLNRKRGGTAIYMQARDTASQKDPRKVAARPACFGYLINAQGGANITAGGVDANQEEVERTGEARATGQYKMKEHSNEKTQNDSVKAKLPILHP